MTTQEDFRASKRFIVYGTEEKEGELKTKNPTDNPYERRTVTNRGDEDSPFSIDVKLVTCVHGYLDKVTPATLIILNYVILPADGNVVKSVKTSLVFRNKLDNLKTLDHPTVSVAAYAPFDQTRKNHTTGDKTKKQGGKIGIGADAAPAKVDGELSIETEESHEQQYFERFEGGRRHRDVQDIHDKVWWRAIQNKSQKHGIDPVFRVAALITRKDQSEFTANFKIRIDGGVTYNIGRVLSDWTGRAVIDEPIIFLPSSDAFGKEECDCEINDDALHELFNGYMLTKKLVTNWGAPDWE